MYVKSLLSTKIKKMKLNKYTIIFSLVASPKLKNKKIYYSTKTGKESEIIFSFSKEINNNEYAILVL